MELKLSQLQKIQTMLTLCQQYVDGDKKTLQTDACNWLPTLKHEVQQRVEFRTHVLRRLKAYYAKKCFQLYLASLQAVELQQPEIPLKLNTDAGWSPEGVKRNNELIIYGTQNHQNPIRA